MSRPSRPVWLLGRHLLQNRWPAWSPMKPNTLAVGSPGIKEQSRRLIAYEQPSDGHLYRSLDDGRCCSRRGSPQKEECLVEKWQSLSTVLFHERRMPMSEEQYCTSDIAADGCQNISSGFTHQRYHHTMFMDGRKTLQLSGIAPLLSHPPDVVSRIVHPGRNRLHPSEGCS